MRVRVRYCAHPDGLIDTASIEVGETIMSLAEAERLALLILQKKRDAEASQYRQIMDFYKKRRQA